MKLQDLEKKYEEGNTSTVDASTRKRSFSYGFGGQNHRYNEAGESGFNPLVLPGEDITWVSCPSCGGNLMDCTCPWPSLRLE